MKHDITSLRKETVVLGEELLLEIGKLEFYESVKKHTMHKNDKNNIIRKSVPEAVSFVEKQNLDETKMVIIDFDDIICTNLNSAYINGVHKYDPNKDPEELIFLENVELIKQIGFRSPLYILAERNDVDKIKEIMAKINLLKLINPIIDTTSNLKYIIKDIIKEKSDQNIEHLYFISNNYDTCKGVNDMTKGVLNSTIIFANLINDMRNRIKKEKGMNSEKIIMEMQKEYLDFILVD